MRKDKYSDVTEAVRFLVRHGAEFSLKEKTIKIPMKKRGLKVLGAVDFVRSIYKMELIDA